MCVSGCACGMDVSVGVGIHVCGCGFVFVIIVVCLSVCLWPSCYDHIPPPLIHVSEIRYYA